MLKLDRQNETFWINVEGGDFLVRPISLTEDNKMRQQCTKTKRGVEQTDTTQLIKRRFSAVVQDWKNIEIDGDYNPECNRANKDWIVDNFTSIAADVIQESENQGFEAKEADNENLSGTSRGGNKSKKQGSAAENV